MKQILSSALIGIASVLAVLPVMAHADDYYNSVEEAMLHCPSNTALIYMPRDSSVQSTFAGVEFHSTSQGLLKPKNLGAYNIISGASNPRFRAYSGHYGYTSDDGVTTCSYSYTSSTNGTAHFDLKN